MDCHIRTSEIMAPARPNDGVPFTQSAALKIIALSVVFGYTSPAICNVFRRDRERVPSRNGLRAVLRRNAEGRELVGHGKRLKGLTCEEWAFLKSKIDDEPRLYVKEMVDKLRRRFRRRFTQRKVLAALHANRCVHQVVWAGGRTGGRTSGRAW